MQISKSKVAAISVSFLIIIAGYTGCNEYKEYKNKTQPKIEIYSEGCKKMFKTAVYKMDRDGSIARKSFARECGKFVNDHGKELWNKYFAAYGKI